jgi:methylenetetrahydrofolate dehydrogenase (NADP+)/methenyltetrahydrofolate cyclohydrolase
MKILSGKEIAGYIEERQAKAVRGLKQAHGVYPKLAIIRTNDDPRITAYISVKRRYGGEIGVEVEEFHVSSEELVALIDSKNEDPSIHGIILQLPLADPDQTTGMLKRVSKEKDVDGLSENSPFDPATPTAILWLLAGYNIDLTGKKVLIIGQGSLVGLPLTKMLLASGIEVDTADKHTQNLHEKIAGAEVIISATGQPGIVQSSAVQEKAVVVDAGMAVADGKTVGDLADDVRQRDDLKITPAKGGVGPLTVCALFENVILAARNTL